MFSKELFLRVFLFGKRKKHNKRKKKDNRKIEKSLFNKQEKTARGDKRSFFSQENSFSKEIFATRNFQMKKKQKRDD